TMSITDASNPADTFSTSWTINLPTAVGGNTALVGFTGGTGGLTAIQEILTWTYNVTSGSNPPAAPTNLTATGGSGQVGLSWSASSGATSYNVKRSTTSGGPYTTIASPTTTSYTDTGVTNGTTYYYVVSAVNTAGQSANSSQVSATPTASTVINYSSGFTSTGLQLNGSTKLNGTRLRLTDGGTNEASSAFYTTPVNVQSFTTNFSFQMTSATANGMTFVIQNTGSTALGYLGGGLGYGWPSQPSI